MIGPAITAALVALAAWWVSTGAILVAVRRADRTGAAARRALTVATTPMVIVGGYGLWATAATPEPHGAYLAFFAALAVWGWIELAFLTGAVTGPNLRPCRPGVPEWERFLRAWGTLAYHEMLLAGVMAALLIGLREAPNPAGLWTFATLFAARISAKLNLFLGVPRFHTDFLPSALSHLPSHFRRARANWLFPFSIVALTAATGFWLGQAGTGAALLAALTALALLEHALMVLPLPDDRLWRWLLSDRRPQRPLQENRNGL